MKKALFLILEEYADWEGAYLSSTLNQREDWSVDTISLDGIADAHMPSLMSLPTRGIWTLDAYVGEELFGTIVVKAR